MKNNVFHFNQFKFDINWKGIDRDFDILKIEKRNKKLAYKDIKLLDTLLSEEKFNALSVLFSTASAFVLYKKNTTRLKIESIQDWIQGFSEFEGIMPRWIELPTGYRKVGRQEIYKNQMIQLLLNATKSQTEDKYSFNNINGGLVISSMDKSFYDDEKRYIKALEIKFWDDVLQLNNVTYTSFWRYNDLIKNEFGKRCAKRKKTIDACSKYTFNKAKYRFERYLEETFEGNLDLYVKKKPKTDNTKNSINFFSVNPKYYPISKIGLWNKLFFNSFEKSFGKYARVTQKEYTDVAKIAPLKRKDNELFKSIQSKPVYIIDPINKPLHVKNIIKICKEEFNIDIQESSEEIKDAINLRLIYDKKSSGDIDFKKDTSLKVAIQNFTFNEYLQCRKKDLQKKKKGQNILKAYLRKVLVEAHQKFDISQGKLTIFNWGKLNLKTNWYFAIAERIKLEDGKEIDIIQLVEVTPEGHFNLKTISPDAIDEELIELTDAIFNNKNWDNEKGKSRIAGIIMDGSKNINIIEETEIRTFPNLKLIHEFVMEGHNLKGEFLDVKKILKFIEDFRKTNKPDDTIDKLYNYLQNNIDDEEIEVITIKEQVKSSRTTVCSDFALEFRETFKFWIKFPVTNKEKVGEYYASMVDINFIEENNEVRFWAFKKMSAIETKVFPKTNVVRRLKPWGNSKLLFDKILPTLNVDFVRLESPTVLPFPFKLLREYQFMKDKNLILPVFDFSDFELNI